MGKITNDALEQQKAELDALRKQLDEEKAELEAEKAKVKEERLEVTNAAAELEAEKTRLAEEQSSLQNAVEGSAKPVEMVPVKLYKDKNIKNDVFVCVNGKTYQIQRGVEVMVPKFVKEVLDNTERMDELAIKRQEEAAKNFA